MPEKEYIRLTRPRQNSSPAAFATSSSSLWLGKDHLLVVESTGYSEKYGRFFFKDIQAVAICRTKTGMVRWIILGVVAFFLALLAVAVRDEPAGFWLCGGLAFIVTSVCVLDALPGPTASCSMRTAVHMEVLPSLDRIRRARKVLERLKPLIAAAQGTITPEEVAAQMQAQRVVAPAPASPSPASLAPQAGVGEIPPKIGS